MTARSVLVTGASTGIGAACARRLDRQGWRVFAGVRTEADGDALRDKAGPGLTPVLLDVTDEAGVDAALGTVAAAVGDAGLDGLVNNAGVARGGPVELLPLDQWREQFEVNLFGQVAVTQAALPLLRAAPGRIVFVGSISGRVATPLVAPYAASKHAVEALAAALREELLPWAIRVAVVEPGVVRTPIWSKARSLADELDGALGADAAVLYGSRIESLRRSLAGNAERGVEPEIVAAAIEHALTARRPRPRYLVGRDAVVAGHLARLLPDRLWIALLRRLQPR